VNVLLIVAIQSVVHFDKLADKQVAILAYLPICILASKQSFGHF